MSVVECAQCSATTRQGERCRIRTCKYAHMCWQHTKQLLHLGIKPSTIPNSGSVEMKAIEFARWLLSTRRVWTADSESGVFNEIKRKPNEGE